MLLSWRMKPETTPSTFRQLLREGDRFTDRDFMRVLGIGHPKLKSREADPSLFTVAELLLLAKLIGRPIKDVMKIVLAELERNPQATEKYEEATGQAVGRKYYPRKPKDASKSE
jgi:hypothetical protein